MNYVDVLQFEVRYSQSLIACAYYSRAKT